MSSNMKGLFTIVYVLVTLSMAEAATKTSTGTGNWNASSAWSPSGAPGSADDVIIVTGHTITVNPNTASCKSLTINSGGIFIISSSKELTISGAAGLIVNGTLTNNGGITLSTAGATFTVGASGTLTWNPSTNTVAAATLWTNGNETFASTSTIIIQKWYSMSVPLGSVTTGNFGHLTIDYSGGAVWQQNNSFQTHLIPGTLTILSGYIVLDNSSSITNTSIGNIVLNGSNAYLDFYNGTHTGSFTVNTGSITITSGELDFAYTSGTGNCTVNTTGDVTIGNSGYIISNNEHNGSSTFNISGNFISNGGTYYGVSGGSGNHTLNIAGNMNNLTSSWDANFYCIVDGNGTATLNVTGNVINNCYMDLIWNTGTSGVGNGNAVFTVGGSYTQTAGDFRGIYNLTTYNAGTITMNLHDVSYSGGVFMAYYACNTSSATNAITVTGNLTIAFSASSNVFRLNGLSTLGSTAATSLLTLSITGNLIISGNASAEFSPSNSYGSETITVGGNSAFSGGTQFFQRSAHASTYTNTGNLTVSSGATTYLSYASATTTVLVNGNVILSGGNLAVKADIGSSTLTVNGDYTQSGGNFYAHNNSTTLTSSTITTNVYGAFTQSGGTYRFDDNDNSTGEHILNIYGSNFNLTGSAQLKRDGSNTSSVFGIINFARAGTTIYNRTDNTHDVQRVKYNVKNGTTLNLYTNMQIASHGISSYNQLIVESGGNLNINTFQILPSTSSTYSGLTIKDGARLLQKNAAGLYDNTINAAIRNTINYNLEPNSIVEYNSTTDQLISGYGYGAATGINQKYGILVINNTSTSARAYMEDTMNVRTQIQLTNGKLDLNNNLLIIESGTASAISRTSGYIRSETNAATNNAIVRWMSMSSGAHVFPFGYSNSEYIPITITPTAGMGADVSASTRSCSVNNLPLTNGVTSLSSQGVDVSTTGVIDRWWNISATGLTADIALSYRGSENSTSTSNATSTFSMQAWVGGMWTRPFGSTTGVTSGIGTISASGVSHSGPWVISSSQTALPIELLSFVVKPKDNTVEIKWATAAEKNNDFFTIERAKNGRDFETVQIMDGAGNSNTVLNYRTIDNNPLPGKSYYRLKQTDFNGDFSYSPIRAVDMDGKSQTASTAVEIKSVSPNPFYNQFSVTYNLENEGETDIMLLSINGQIMFNQKVNAEAGPNYFDYTDEKNIPSGNYIITIVNGGNKASKKIIKLNN